jgi:hypothetical protein
MGFGILGHSLLLLVVFITAGLWDILPTIFEPCLYTHGVPRGSLQRRNNNLPRNSLALLLLTNYTAAGKGVSRSVGVCLSIYLSIHLSISPSIYLPASLPQPTYQQTNRPRHCTQGRSQPASQPASRSIRQ